jgi:hypothetical protein
VAVRVVGPITDYLVDQVVVPLVLLVVQLMADLLHNQGNLILELLLMLDSRGLLTALAELIMQLLVPGCIPVAVVVAQAQQAAILVNLDQATPVLIE